MPPVKKSDKEKSQNFKESPFSSADQLNTFLFWFGVVSALLISAFIIQCCREVARGDDDPVPMNNKT